MFNPLRPPRNGARISSNLIAVFQSPLYLTSSVKKFQNINSQSSANHQEARQELTQANTHIAKLSTTLFALSLLAFTIKLDY